jgi:hypothetical protein
MNTAEIREKIAKKNPLPRRGIPKNDLQAPIDKASLEEVSTETLEDAEPDDELSLFYETAKQKILHAYQADKEDITKESVDKVACGICIKAREVGVRFPLYLPETNPLQHPLLVHLQEKHGHIPHEHQKGWRRRGKPPHSFFYPESSVNQHLTKDLRLRPYQICKYCHKECRTYHGTMEECLDRTLKAVLANIINRVVRAIEYPFICKYCGDGFLTELTRKKHYNKCLQVISLEGENGKLCKLCMEIKDKVLFSTKTDNKDALDSYCKKCRNVKYDEDLLGFICKYCGDAFFTELTMKSHYRKCLQVISQEGENGKLCQLCMEIKDKVVFSKNMRNKDALDSYCRDCNKVKVKGRIKKVFSTATFDRMYFDA